MEYDFSSETYSDSNLCSVVPRVQCSFFFNWIITWNVYFFWANVFLAICNQGCQGEFQPAGVADEMCAGDPVSEWVSTFQSNIPPVVMDPRHKIPDIFIAITTGLVRATTVAPHSSRTEATTSLRVSGTAKSEASTGIACEVTGLHPLQTFVAQALSHLCSEATTFADVGMRTAVRAAANSTSVAARVTTSPYISQPVCPSTLPPTPVCRGPLGEEKSPGDIWTSNCHQCTCTEAQAVDCKWKECPSPPTCKTGEKLMTFKSNDSCCEIGHCEPRTCLFNNTEYEIGSSFDDPSNPCVTYTCNSTGLAAVVQDCPKQTWCAERERTYDSKKCCYTCKSDCRTAPVKVTIKYNGCRKKVQMARCVGECKRTVKYNYNTHQLENSCFSCREDNYELRDIDLDCSDGSTIPYQYRHTTTCSCLDQCAQSTAS
ncbi:apomucin-like [Psammomys obesus]|uniref:apomucin-like n=1 Tax=Psammomys obesus TaxID=48139 RepID=UPI002452C6CB|nr:apomucin-like [Psammomys obesus]